MADGKESDSQDFPLHECVFKGDIRKLSQLLRTADVSKKDKHGTYEFSNGSDPAIHCFPHLT